METRRIPDEHRALFVYPRPASEPEATSPQEIEPAGRSPVRFVFFLFGVPLMVLLLLDYLEIPRFVSDWVGALR